MKRLVFLVLMVFVGLGSLVYGQEYRDFVGANGKTITAKFIEYSAENETAKIELKNGKIQNVRLNLFSEKDQEWIKAGGKDATDDPFSEADENNSQELIHLRIYLDELGKGQLAVQKVDEPVKTKFNGKPFKLLALPKTPAYRSDDGIFQIIHDFNSDDSIIPWKGDSMRNNQIVDDGVFHNQDEKYLEMTPVGGLFPNTNCSVFFYKTSFLLPVTCDLYFHNNPTDNNEIQVCISCSATRDRFIVRYKNLDRNSLQVEADFGKSWEKKDNKQVFSESSVALGNEVWTKDFRLPVQKIDTRNMFLLRYEQAGNNKSSLKIKEFDLTGRFIPSLGAYYEENNGSVKIRFISSPNELAARSGLVVGDIIKSINGKTVKTVAEVEKVIADTPYGNPLTIKIDRRGREQTVKVNTN